MTVKSMTSRRSFLKTGAIVAAPLAVAGAPAAAALGGDTTRARLMRIEDERAIGALNRAFLRGFNAGERTGALAPDDIVHLALDPDAEPEQFAFSGDGTRAEVRLACLAQREQQLEGEGSLIEMARLQGNGPARLSEARNFVGNYIRTAQGWAIERIELA